MNTIDNALMGFDEEEEEELASIANQARMSLHLQQAKKYSLGMKMPPQARYKQIQLVIINPSQMTNSYSMMNL